MTVQINSDKNVKISENFIARIAEDLKDTLSHFEEFITRIEVFLADENSARQGSNDKQCKIEVRIKSLNPETVTATADDVDLAFKQAKEKVLQLVRTRVDKLKSHS